MITLKECYKKLQNNSKFLEFYFSGFILFLRKFKIFNLSDQKWYFIK